MDVDLRLVERLEATSATASLDLVHGIKSLDPATVAEGREFGIGALIAMGSRSLCESSHRRHDDGALRG